jgi:hypothetical protein
MRKERVEVADEEFEEMEAGAKRWLERLHFHLLGRESSNVPSLYPEPTD